MALDDIRISLQLLAETVENLEREIETKEKAAKAPKNLPPQIDMFGGWSPKPAHEKDNVLLAKKLDSTINKIQNLLKEGAA